ncbi:unnamed protein product, partial [Plutella xylostella]
NEPSVKRSSSNQAIRETSIRYINLSVNRHFGNEFLEIGFRNCVGNP